MSAVVKVLPLEEGAIWHVILNTPKANILDAAMVAALTSVFEKAAGQPELKAIMIEGEGSHFSFGASIEEHLPGKVAGMLSGFHRMFQVALETSVPLLAVVSGQCLGGGLELASFCNRIFAAEGAKLGQPEMNLGVFAPVASVILSDRVGRAHAEDLCVAGRIIPASEALQIGLVDEVVEDPRAAALEYAQKNLLPKSASSIRFAIRAVRWRFAQQFTTDIAELERFYLEELMASHDAGEGLQSFLDKRKPEWKNA